MLKSPLEWVYKKFKEDTAHMLVVTGTAGWVLSSAAQLLGLQMNSKIPTEQKKYLIPQEFFDAVANIGAFFVITASCKKLISKLVTTGKFAPQKVRDFLNKNKDLYGDKVGKLSFNLDEVMKSQPESLKQSYDAYKNHVTTLGTVGAGILSANIVTPIVRNSLASRAQNKYLNNKPANYSTGMKI